ncbi:hypothetical protein niasHT_036730 [Heterodera trifolii]|uniref:Uncharacterized protein n=1 Tax=Heterodera trifolii TaxID=157864 RepID=A0ABD2ISP7_9BILA
MEIDVPNWKLPFYLFNESIEKLKPEKAIENFRVLHSLTNVTATVYEILKLARTLGDAENNSQLERGFAEQSNINCDYLNQSAAEEAEGQQIFGKIVEFLSDKNANLKNGMKIEFCILAHFVGQLISEMFEQNQIPTEENDDTAAADELPENEKDKWQSEQSVGVTIGRLILARDKFCKTEQYEFEKDIQEDMLNFVKVISIEYDAQKRDDSGGAHHFAQNGKCVVAGHTPAFSGKSPLALLMG